MYLANDASLLHSASFGWTAPLWESALRHEWHALPGGRLQRPYGGIAAGSRSLTFTSSERMPASRARFAAVMRLLCGERRSLSRTLETSEPALDQQTTLPSMSQIVTTVLLNVA